MQMNVEKFLALTALLAAATATGCTVETVDSGDHPIGAAGAGTTGTAGSAGSSAGSSGAAGSASTEGTDDGGTSDASVDAGAASCFAEGTPDGGAEAVCDVLPYINDTCSADDDAGVEGGATPLGASLCTGLGGVLNPAAFSQLLGCLKSAPGVAGDGGMASCAASNAAAAACSTTLFQPSTCPVPASAAADGGTFGCAEVVTSCPADDASAGITLEKCQGWLGPFTAATRQTAIDCYLDPGSEGATCAEKFENCVFPPVL